MSESEQSLSETETPPPKGQILSLNGIRPGEIAYNPTQPIVEDGVYYIASRVEPYHSENSKTVFFRAESPESLVWDLDPTMPVFRNLQDPRITEIEGDLVLFGTKTFRRHEHDFGVIDSYRDVAYRGSGLRELKPFWTGPVQMKDTFAKGTYDGWVVVFRRPEKVRKNGSGENNDFETVKYPEYSIVRPEQFRYNDFPNAVSLYELFGNGETGAIDWADDLGDGLMGILFHKACVNDDIKSYKLQKTVLDLVTGQFLEPEDFATRDDFPDAPVKVLPGKPEHALKDVVFLGGASVDYGQIKTYCGLSDCAPGLKIDPEPFAEYRSRRYVH